jgi:hypothetical protein
VRGINVDDYWISLDDGANWYDAYTSPPTGVTVNTRTATALDFTISTEGQHLVKIMARDNQDNKTIYPTGTGTSVKIDKTSPVAPVVVTNFPEFCNTATPPIAGTGEKNCTLTIKESSTTLNTLTVDSSGNWSTNLSELSDGQHTLSITQTDAAGNKSEATDITIKIDTTGPTGTISIKGNSWSSFLNTITFGLFFKNTVNVTIASADTGGSGVKSTEYLKSENSYNETNIASQIGWATYAPFSITPTEREQAIIYAKITDNAGNVKYIRSDGVVIYKDSAQDTESISFTKTSNSNVQATVTLDGNMINKIENYTNETEPDMLKTLVLGEDYAVKESTITFKASYLDSLAAGSYALKIYYSPAGTTFVEDDENQMPETTNIELTVNKAAQSTFTVTDLNSSYTYGDNSFAVSTSGGSGDGAVTFESSEPSVAEVVGSTVTVKNTGTFKITATKATDENYNQTTAQSGNIAVNPKPVTITGLSASDKVYDSSVSAKIIGTPSIPENLDGENLTVVQGDANFENKNAGDGKIVAFSGFSLGGTAVENYTLSAQPASVTANITPKPVTILGVAAENKVYDGRTSAQISGTASIDENLDGENLTIVQGSANFENRNVGNSKTVTFSGFTLAGIEANNYNLIEQPISVMANITQKPLDIVNTAVKNKVYDGTAKAEFINQPQLKKTDVVSGDIVNLQSGAPKFSNVNISSKPIKISFGLFKISGKDANNYQLIQPSGITAKITEIPPQEFVQIDESTGVCAEAPANVLPNSAVLAVEKLEEKTINFESMFSIIDEGESIAGVDIFNITIVNEDGEKIQPDTNFGDVTLKLPIPDNFDEKYLKVVRIIEDAPNEELPITGVVYENGFKYCEVKTTHFSLYALMNVIDNAGGKDEENWFEKNKMIIFSMILLLIILAIMMVLYNKLRKNSKNIK